MKVQRSCHIWHGLLFNIRAIGRGKPQEQIEND